MERVVLQIRINKDFSFDAYEPSNDEFAAAKLVSKSDGNGATARRGWVRSIMSVQVKDADGDLMRARPTPERKGQGCHPELLLKKGYFCYEHPSRADMIVGRPVSVPLIEDPVTGAPAVGANGFFYLDDKLGEALYEKAVMLAKAEPDDPLRRLAMSAEGRGWNVLPYNVPGGRYDIADWEPHTLAVTHRAKVETATIHPDVVEIAASLAGAERLGGVDNVLEMLVSQRRLMRDLRAERGFRDDDAYVSYVMSKHGLPRSRAMALVVRARKIVA